jgi:hypothetical protein
MPRPLFSLGKHPVPIVQESGWAPRPVWTDAENLALTGIRSPDRPARSQSLHRLRYPAHCVNKTLSKLMSLHASSLKSVVKNTAIRVAEEILTKLNVISPAYSRYFTLKALKMTHMKRF